MLAIAPISSVFSAIACVSNSVRPASAITWPVSPAPSEEITERASALARSSASPARIEKERSIATITNLVPEAMAEGDRRIKGFAKARASKASTASRNASNIRYFKRRCFTEL